MGRVEGKIALVTGGAQGLGAAIAARLAAEGAKVLVTDINGEGAAATASAIQNDGGVAESATHDVTDLEAWTAAVDQARSMGGLNILVNNAGIGSIGNVVDESVENWRRVHAVDLDSVFYGCKVAIPLMAESGGSIVNISSIAGIIAGHNYAAYNSAKAAVCHLSKSIALDCARQRNGIRCNSVHPVFIDTPILDGMARPDMERNVLLERLGNQIPLGQVGHPDDVAYGVLYLASDESRFVTGSELRIDGGISAM